MTIEELKKMNNEQLIDNTARLITLQNQCIAKQIVFIMEIDRRRLHWGEGHANLATFLVEKFALSEDQAYKRIRVARAVAFFPQLLEPLRRGETTLTNLSLAAPRLTEANCALVLENIKGRSKRQAAEFLGRVGNDGSIVDGEDPCVELKIRVPRKLIDKLQRAKEVMAARGQNPGTADVFAAALETLLDRKDPMRKAQRAAARREKFRSPSPAADREPAPNSQAEETGTGKTGRRPLPAALKHEVWLRDGGRCTFETDDGHRCGEKGMLEIDHIVPVCRGGDNSPANLRLRCRAHNQHAAEISLGSAFMAAKRGDQRSIREIKREPIEKVLLVPEPVDLVAVMGARSP